MHVLRPFRGHFCWMINSMDDDAVMDRLIRTYDPTWIFAQHCLSNVRARLQRLVAEGQWVPTYVDARIAVLVQRRPEIESFISAHEMVAISADALPKDLLAGPPALRAKQMHCYKEALQALRPGGHEAGL